MTSGFERASQLFLGLRKLAPEDRSKFLDSECRGDDVLRREVEALLAADERPVPLEDLGERIRQGSKAGAAPSNGDSVLIDDELREGEGGAIGAYRLLEKLGEGGFGSVYMAEQSVPFRRLVALKVLKPGMDSRQVIARFEAERQALALMDHPNITRILDSGATQRGRPYFVMDLVRGVPITEFVKNERQTSRQILELMLPVCRAVHHAHQKGILHRDLKPSNVLVTLHDGKPVPKVIDFGIAKALHGRLTDMTLFTQFKQFIGTPAYMSPEQAEMSGLDIDTRSDIYSLGVLLYELLTGSTPIEKAKLARCSQSDVQRILRESEPPTPSRRLTAITSENSAAASTSETEIARARSLAKQIRGDIDWIVMRCLEKDRTRRYASADALAADIERYLRDEPVEAGPPGVLYRASKYARRHRVFFASSIGVLLTICVGLLLALIGLREARDQRDLAMTAREKAMGEAARANAVVGLLLDMFGGADPTNTRTQSDSLRRLLDDFAALQTEKLADQPAVLLTVNLVVGKAYTSLGEYQKARVYAESAVDIARRLYGASHLDVARALDQFGTIELRLGDAEAAEKNLNEALTIKRRTLPALSDEIANTLNLLAGVKRTRMLYQESLGLSQEALAIERSIHGDAHELVGTSLLSLANSYIDLGMLGDAENSAREALDAYKKALRPDHPFVANALERLSSIKSMRGDSKNAEELIRQALDLRIKAFGETHYEVAVARANLGLILRARGDFDQAIPLLESARATTIASFGENSSQSALMTGSVGATLLLAARPQEAEPLLRRAITVLLATLGPDSVELANQQSNLANLLAQRGEYDEAATFARAAVETRRKHFGEFHQATAFGLHTLADIVLRQGKLEEAEKLVREAQRSLETAVGKEHPAYARGQTALSRVLRRRGALDSAEAAAREALEIGRRILPNPHPELAGFLEEVAILLAEKNDHESAEHLLTEAAGITEALYGSDDFRSAELRSRLGSEIVELGRFEEAGRILTRAQEQLEASPRTPHASITASIQRLAMLYDRWQRPEEAAKWRARLETP